MVVENDDCGLTDGETRSLRRASNVNSLEGSSLAGGRKGEDLDLGGVGGKDVHEAGDRGQSQSDSKLRDTHSLFPTVAISLSMVAVPLPWGYCYRESQH